MDIIATLRSRQNEIEARLSEFTKQLTEGTVLSDEQLKEVDDLKAEFDRNAAQVRAADIAANVQVQAAAPTYKVSVASAGQAPAFVRGAKAFKGLGDMAMAIFRQRTNTASPAEVQRLADEHGRKLESWRRENALDGGINIGTDSQGGYAVPGEYDTTVDRLVLNDQSLLPLCRQRPMSQDVAKVPTNDVYPWAVYSGTDGPAVVSEGGTYTSASIVLGQATLTLSKVGHIVPFTLEAAKFGAVTAADLMDGAQLALTYKVNQTIVAGLTGAAGAHVVPSGSTASGSFTYDDSVAMYNRLPSEWIGPSTRWVINPDMREKFQKFALSGTQGFVPVYLPANAQLAPFGSVLHGIPVQPFFGMRPIGTQGDVLLCDFSKVWAGTAGPVLLDYDAYAGFENGKGAFRWTYFLGVTPRLTTKPQPPNGQALSAYVVKASRS
ncbi:hypothetical protein A2cp1_1305 [Anaeromyxobacter dehalogenans 2CP-1]|uniref:Phage capsid-like C-terminal domain-containing protein n=1 Tax=Anaeromyxobacter dehalogenans (strain ATCC BAA-258 / DSM 21875 / 2CP-1) TaxID=455488 RepID=B8JGH8_ANAD2|nr:phage major capsid protein [Anaeromyxobacter dehalogenans]ACL64649.1 hypothetical protein A2cp1_1305 [Anaeromyxobacter dehalogenans 2CP-1]